MTFKDRLLNSMVFQTWKMKSLNSLTFQVFHDLYEPCHFIVSFSECLKWMLEEGTYQCLSQRNLHKLVSCKVISKSVLLSSYRHLMQKMLYSVRTPSNHQPNFCDLLWFSAQLSWFVLFKVFKRILFAVLLCSGPVNSLANQILLLKSPSISLTSFRSGVLPPFATLLTCPV